MRSTASATSKSPADARPIGRRRRGHRLQHQGAVLRHVQGRARHARSPSRKDTITAFIGPSGCGKSTVLRCLNRMNDLVRGFRFTGHVHFHGKDIYDPSIDPVAVRRHIGMVFQQPNPFAMSIYRNVTFGLRLNGYRGNKAEKVEEALRGAALWDEVKDKLHKSALALSGGQQQRLCIARAIATEPAVLLMDEPCSALDPIATRKIEELMLELKKRFTIAIVTHNLQQAQRVADKTGFLYVDTTQGGRTGYLVEFGDTEADLRESPREAHAGVHPRRVQLTSFTQRDADHAGPTIYTICIFAGTLLFSASCSPAGRATQGQRSAGAGGAPRRAATFPAPLYERWFADVPGSSTRMFPSAMTPWAAEKA